LSLGITRIFAAFWSERNRDCRGAKDEVRGQGDQGQNEVHGDDEVEAMSRIAVIGAGSWGTGLSIVLGRRGSHQVRLWAHEKEVRDSISTRRINNLFLPGEIIPESVSPTGSLADALNQADIVVSVMPSQHCRQLFEQMRPHLTSNMLFVSATKGLEEDTLLRMTEVIAQVVSQKIASVQGFRPRIGALSGPSFAKEVARGDPTAITIASQDAALAETIQREFGDPRFRVYTNDDVAGVELGGALKNVIAIAAGVCDGLGLGHNSIAALITRGLAEITRLAVACGGRRETLAGLAGLGDLVLTCTGGLSRNRSVGVELGRGRKLPDIIAGMHGAVAEGVFTTQAAIGLARARGVEMPITEQMDAILHRSKAPADAIRDLMARSGKSEIALSS
jgi:glycerol-3-phosphate dehydrogenase (NAD(P)+)